MGFSDCPCYWPLGRTNRASVLSRCQGLGRLNELTFSLGLVSGPAHLLNPISSYDNNNNNNNNNNEISLV